MFWGTLVLAQLEVKYGSNKDEEVKYGITKDKGAKYGVNKDKDVKYGVNEDKGVKYGINQDKAVQYGVNKDKKVMLIYQGYQHPLKLRQNIIDTLLENYLNSQVKRNLKHERSIYL